MYSTCLFCHGSLGGNEVVEVFPVGRRLAFDPAKGRLWVVCPRCKRWNLTPLEERWEAIEECERRFRGTVRRRSTENVGVAYLSSGLTLVRVGEPLRPELAAWRYGRELGWRRTRRAVAMGLGLTGAAALGVAGAPIGGGLLALTVAYGLGNHRLGDLIPRRVVARVRADGRVLEVRREDIERTVVYPDHRSGGHSLLLHHRGGVEPLRGEKACGALAKLMPAINHAGAAKHVVADAATILDSADSIDDYVAWMLKLAARPRFGILELPEAASLAFEMALNEDVERRALDGELATLERSWREAEEIAAIADSLLVPAGVLSALQRMKTVVRSAAV
jgi:hypothetical protein